MRSCQAGSFMDLCERGKKQRAATFKSYWWIRQGNTAVVNSKQLAHFPVSQVQKAITGS